MVGIAVITHNSEACIGACLDSCLREPGAAVLVVDNASSDGTVSIVKNRPGVKLLQNQENRGFAVAANQAVRHLETPYIVLLNPDAFLLNRLDSVILELDSHGVGAAAGCLVEESTGVPQAGFSVRNFPSASSLSAEVLGLNRLWPANPINRRYRHPLPAEPADVQQPAGAFLAFRRDAWERIGGFDESFHPVWFEDVDFCKRLANAGYRIRYVPDVRAAHSGGHSVGRIPWEFRQLYWYGSLLRYASKHLSPPGRRAVCIAVILACFMRALAGFFTSPTRKPVSVYSKVVWAAIGHLFEESAVAKGGSNTPSARRVSGTSQAVEKQ